jgi:hypothetical protein
MEEQISSKIYTNPFSVAFKPSCQSVCLFFVGNQQEHTVVTELFKMGKQIVYKGKLGALAKPRHHDGTARARVPLGTLCLHSLKKIGKLPFFG